VRSRLFRHPRLRRLLIAPGALTLATSVIALVASGFWHYEYRRWDDNGFSCRYFQIARGRVEAGRTDLFRVMDAGPAHSLKYQSDIPLRWRWSSCTSRPVVSFERYWPAQGMCWDWIISIPLWIPAAASAAALVPPVYLSMRRKRHGKTGRCVGCGYSLAGLSGDICPECGRTVANLP